MPATIAEELTAEDVPIERIVTTGQHVEGSYDPEATGSTSGRACAPQPVLSRRTPSVTLS